MNLAGLFHYAGGAYASAVTDAVAALVLRVAHQDRVRVTAMASDRYAPLDSAVPWPMAPAASDGFFDYYRAAVEMPTRRLRYYFRIEDDEQAVLLGPRGPGASVDETGQFELPYLYPDDSAPAWLYGAVLYQIMPDRFYPGDGTANSVTAGHAGRTGTAGARPPGHSDQLLAWDEEPTPTGRYAGTLRGIADRLDYISGLGINTIYMTPLFDAATYHGYNINDYYRVHPALGTAADLRALADAAHGRGMRVMLDGVFNHSGFDFFAFQDVRQRGRQSPYWDWFQVYDEPVRVNPPNYETFANGVVTMPKLMTANPEVQAYFAAVGAYWLRMAGIDGWRLDVANEVHPQFWRRFRTAVREVNPASVLLGEIWHDAGEYLRGDMFDTVMHYQWRDAVVDFLATGRIDATGFARAWGRLQAIYSPLVAARLVTLIGSHDTPRFLTLAGGRRERLVMAAALQAALPGVPMIYYGDEIGMTGGADPGCRRAMAWDRMDQGVLAAYRRVLELRRAYPWLGWAEVTPVVVDGDRNVFAFRARRPAWNPPGVEVTAAGDEELYVILNAGPNEYVTGENYRSFSGREAVDLWSGDRWQVDVRGIVSVPSGHAVILRPGPVPGR